MSSLSGNIYNGKISRRAKEYNEMACQTDKEPIEYVVKTSEEKDFER